MLTDIEMTTTSSLDFLHYMTAVSHEMSDEPFLFPEPISFNAVKKEPPPKRSNDMDSALSGKSEGHPSQALNDCCGYVIVQ